MSEWVRFDLDEEGTSVLVEVTADDPGLERLSRRGDAFAKAKASFEDSLVGVRDAASAALRRFQGMAVPPDEVEISFGVKLSVEGTAVIAKSGLEGQLEVKIKWQRKESETGPA
ncbi:CU044_2847 family protein [Actinoallomurus acanthiterrae]